MIWPPILALMVFLNRFRGGGYGAEHLPGHPRFYVVPMVALLAYVASRDWVTGALFGAGYLGWSLLPWGHLYSFGRHMPDRAWSWIESMALRVGGEDYRIAFFLVQAVGSLALIPFGIWTGSFAGALFAPAVTGAYLLAWRVAPPARAIEVAELLTGLIWGAILLFALAGCAPINVDVNGYHQKAAKAGQPIHCKGACP